MSKILLNICFVFFASYANAQVPVTDPKVIAYINSLSLEQLYDIYATQVQIYTDKFVQNKAFAYANQDVIKQCTISILQNTFNKNDMRILFLQPSTMDVNYYTNKINSMFKPFEICFHDNYHR
jgi:hypothetical protein